LHDFQALTPDVILDALSALGLEVDGRLSALSSYENRVYVVMLDSGESVVAKFYRPRRWSSEQILEEHAFALDLHNAEVPVVAPLVMHGETLHSTNRLGVECGVDFMFSVCPKRGGRAPELDDPEILSWLGRYMARIHNTGQTRPFVHRECLNIETMGEASVRAVTDIGLIPDIYKVKWLQHCEAALRIIGQSKLNEAQALRIHGDCHSGNILWTPIELSDGGPHFVDLDDAKMGPAVQDLWMMLSGDRAQRSYQLCALLDGYTSMREFDTEELQLIEPLRTLRMIHYSAWLCKRADDPAFAINFPWFWGAQYWQTQIDQLSEQIEAMQEPALVY
jgi:Ser/Thr protein kinase RdoA (MazF antagonist)